MIYPKLFEIIKDDPSVQAIFGTDPVRVFPFGMARQNEQRFGVYATFQTVNSSPYNLLGEVPKGDDFLVQVDVYALDAEDVRRGATALIKILEQDNYIQSIRGESREFDTKLYRFSFDVQIIQERE